MGWEDDRELKDGFPLLLLLHKTKGGVGVFCRYKWDCDSWKIAHWDLTFKVKSGMQNLHHFLILSSPCKEDYYLLRSYFHIRERERKKWLQCITLLLKIMECKLLFSWSTWESTLWWTGRESGRLNWTFSWRKFKSVQPWRKKSGVSQIN